MPIYIKFTRHIGHPRQFIYAFDGVNEFREWYAKETAFTGERLPAKASIATICNALCANYNRVERVSYKEAKRFEKTE